MKFFNFLRYNNAVPLVIFALFLSAGGAFAATNPDLVLSKQQQVLTVDNTYIANKDLSNYTPTVTIKGVTEDADSYQVSYTISTIDIDNYVWKDVVKSDTMTVAKADLNGRDLGLYVTGQFRNIIANQITFLQQVQEKERKQISQQTVATTYGGLIGRFLSSNTETLPGYTPAVVTPSTPDITTVAGQAASSTGIVRDTTGSGSAPDSNAGNSPDNSSSGNSSVLSLQVLGNNPAIIDLNASYNDLGVVLIDPSAPNLGYYTYVDGVKQSDVNIDTRVAGSHTVEYRATDQNGVLVVAQRIVLVGNQTDSATTTNTGTTASSTGDTQ